MSEPLRQQVLGSILTDRQPQRPLTGEYCVLNGYLTRNDVERALASQRAEANGSAEGPGPRSKVRVPENAIAPSIALAVAAILSYWRDWPIDKATEVAGFTALVTGSTVAFLIGLALARFRDRSFTASIMEAGKNLILFVSGATLLAGYLAYTELDSVVGAHVGVSTEMQSGINTWLNGLRLAFLALASSTFVLLLYALWKFAGLRCAESRFGVIKDATIKFEDRMWRTGGEPDPKGALLEALKGLQNAISIAPGSGLLRIAQTLTGRPIKQSTVLFAVPSNQGSNFRLVECVCSPTAGLAVSQEWDRLKSEHHPVFLDQIEFSKLMTLARGDQEKFLSMPGDARAQVVSACGWVYAHGRMLFEPVAARSLHLDTTLLDKVQTKSPTLLPWFSIGSFIACPVRGIGHQTTGVLLVLNTSQRGLSHQDREATVVVSQLIARIHPDTIAES